MSAVLTLKCSKCGDAFRRYRCHVKRDGYGQFCSKSCAKAARPKAVVGSNACIRAAFDAGYRATDDGRILDPKGAEVRLKRNNSSRYWTFSAKLCRTPMAVHRFAAYQRDGEAALAADCVRHLDDNRDNNAIDNLKPGTRSENQRDIPLEKRRLMGTRRNRKKRQFTDDQVRELRLLIKEGFAMRRLQRIFDCAIGALFNVRNGVTYRDVA